MRRTPLTAELVPIIMSVLVALSTRATIASEVVLISAAQSMRKEETGREEEGKGREGEGERRVKERERKGKERVREKRREGER